MVPLHWKAFCTYTPLHTFGLVVQPAADTHGHKRLAVSNRNFIKTCHCTPLILPLHTYVRMYVHTYVLRVKAVYDLVHHCSCGKCQSTPSARATFGTCVCVWRHMLCLVLPNELSFTWCFLWVCVGRQMLYFQTSGAGPQQPHVSILLPT